MGNVRLVLRRNGRVRRILGGSSVARERAKGAWVHDAKHPQGFYWVPAKDFDWLEHSGLRYEYAA